MNFIIKVLAPSFLLSTLFFSCVSPTKVEKKWISEERVSTGEVNEKTIVFAFVKSEPDRIKMEDLFYNASNNISPSYKTFSSEDILKSKAEIRQELIDEGFKYAITMRLVRKSLADEWVPANYPNNYETYHSNFMMDYYNPGYYITGNEYFIETNLFSLANGKLCWSVTTKTPETLTREEFIDELGAAIIRQMRKDKLMK